MKATALFVGLSTISIACAPGALADPAATIPGDGVFRVGQEVAPGTYVSAGPGNGHVMCTWMTHNTLGSSDIADGNSSSGQLYARIPSTVAAFETSGCQQWRQVS